MPGEGLPGPGQPLPPLSTAFVKHPGGSHPKPPSKSAAPAKPVASASAKPVPAAPAIESATTIPKRKQAPETDR